MNPVSLTLSPPVRVAAFVGILVATGLAAVVFLLGRSMTGDEAGSTATPATHPAKATTTPATPETPATKPSVVRHHAGPVRTRSGLPPKVDHALRYQRVVVVSVSMPGGVTDQVVRAEARAGAAASRAGFVRLSAQNEPAMRMLFTKTGIVSTPAIVVVRRPGVVETVLGVTDRETVAQAVAQARR